MNTSPGPNLQAQLSQQSMVALGGLGCVEPKCSGFAYPPGFEDYVGVVGPSSRFQMSNELNEGLAHGNNLVEGASMD